MADTNHCSESNGAVTKKHPLAATATDVSARPTKRIKMEEEEPPEANPNTMRAVTERNRQLELDLIEKNRRIRFLTQKCESLFRRRAITDASFRCIRRQWLQLLDDLNMTIQIADGSADVHQWNELVDAVDVFAIPRSRDVKLVLPEWFLALSRGDDTVQLSEHDDQEIVNVKAEMATIDAELSDQMEKKYQQAKALTARLLSVIERIPASSDGKLSTDSWQHQFVREKRQFMDEILKLKEKSQLYKRHIFELERDLERKEIERHQACRDYDRLSEYMERNKTKIPSNPDATADGAKIEKAGKAVEKKVSIKEEDKKQQLKDKEHEKMLALLRENMSILSTKLYQERSKTDQLKRDVDKLKAMEDAWNKEEALLKQEMEDKVEHLREEKNHLAEELAKIRHKVTEMENHVTEKWQKKMAKMQVDMTKAKTQMDEVNIKNVALRDKLSSLSAYRDQLHDLKSVHESTKRENEKLHATINRLKTNAERQENTEANSEIKRLSELLNAQKKTNEALQASYDALRSAEADEKVAALTAKLDVLQKQHEQLLEEHAAAQATLEKMRLENDDLKAAQEASREENDALVSEIEIINKEMEAVRHSKKKVVQQLEEKKTSNKKLRTQLSKEEQAKAHCFEELAAARLQVSSLGTVHKQQKQVLESLKDTLQAKTKEYEQLQAYVKTLECEKDAADAEKRKVLREAEVAKHIYTTSAAETTQKQQQLIEEKKKPCEKCEEYRQKQEKYEKMLQPGSANGNTGDLNSLERLELKDLQKVVKCSVCQDRRKTVIISKCFHMFCKECIDNNLKARNRKCPTCKKMFGQDDVKNVWFT